MAPFCIRTNPANELPTNREPPRSRRKSSVILASRLSTVDPDIPKKLEELNSLARRRSSVSRTSKAPLQKQYDDFEARLDKCQEDLKDLQRKAVTAPAQQLKDKYLALQADLKKCKDDAVSLQHEAQNAGREEQNRYAALDFVLAKYREEIEDEMRNCWEQLKLLDRQLEGLYSEEEQDSTDGRKTASKNKSAKQYQASTSWKSKSEKNPRNPRCKLLWKAPPPVRRDKLQGKQETTEATQPRARELTKDKPEAPQSRSRPKLCGVFFR